PKLDHRHYPVSRRAGKTGSTLHAGTFRSSMAAVAHVKLPLLAPQLVEYLRSCKPPPGAFADDVVATICVHGGTYDVETPAGLEEELLRTSPRYDVEVNAASTTPDGFVIDFVQQAEDGAHYREMIWARTTGSKTASMLWYCSGA